MTTYRESLVRDATVDPRWWGPLADDLADTGDPSAEHVRRLAKLGMRFAWCPPGSFLMGSPASEAERYQDETQHRVTLTKGYYLGVHPVTQAQWQAVMGTNPSHFKGADLPVENVSWGRCQEFCAALGGLVRLPTEAEWEYACRAGTTTRFSFGDSEADLGEHAWFAGNSGDTTHPVGKKLPNAWGLHDMHGNVWEWCQDWYGEYPKEVAVDPAGTFRGTSRVLRSGSWHDFAWVCRASYRDVNDPGIRNGNFGFRVALLPA